MKSLERNLKRIMKGFADVTIAAAKAGPMVGEKYRAVGKIVQEQDIYLDGIWKWESVYTANSAIGAQEIARQRNAKYQKGK